MARYKFLYCIVLYCIVLSAELFQNPPVNTVETGRFHYSDELSFEPSNNIPHQHSFGTSGGATTSCDWEGNRRSDVALAMRHRLEWFIHLGAQGLSKGAPHQHSSWGMVLFTLC